MEKRGRGRPKGSKNKPKIEKTVEKEVKTTESCCDQKACCKDDVSGTVKEDGKEGIL